MRCALDTNVLARSIQTDHPHQVVALAAITKLLKQADEVHILPQNLVEFWVLSTRPTKDNGLGLSPSDAEAHIAKF